MKELEKITNEIVPGYEIPVVVPNTEGLNDTLPDIWRDGGLDRGDDGDVFKISSILRISRFLRHVVVEKNPSIENLWNR